MLQIYLRSQPRSCDKKGFVGEHAAAMNKCRSVGTVVNPAQPQPEQALWLWLRAFQDPSQCSCLSPRNMRALRPLGGWSLRLWLLLVPLMGVTWAKSMKFQGVQWYYCTVPP